MELRRNRRKSTAGARLLENHSPELVCPSIVYVNEGVLNGGVASVYRDISSEDENECSFKCFLSGLWLYNNNNNNRDKFRIGVFSSLMPTSSMDRNIDPTVLYPTVLNYPYVGKLSDVIPHIPSLGQYAGFRNVGCVKSWCFSVSCMRGNSECILPFFIFCLRTYLLFCRMLKFDI